MAPVRESVLRSVPPLVVERVSKSLSVSLLPGKRYTLTYTVNKIVWVVIQKEIQKDMGAI